MPWAQEEGSDCDWIALVQENKIGIKQFYGLSFPIKFSSPLFKNKTLLTFFLNKERKSECKATKSQNKINIIKKSIKQLVGLKMEKCTVIH